MSFGGWQWGEDVHLLKSNLKSLKSNILSPAPGTMSLGFLFLCELSWLCNVGNSGFPPVSQWEPSSRKEQWGLGGDRGVRLHPPTPPGSPRQNLLPQSQRQAGHGAPCSSSQPFSATWDCERRSCCLRPRKHSSCFPS